MAKYKYVIAWAIAWAIFILGLFLTVTNGFGYAVLSVGFAWIVGVIAWYLGDESLK